MADTLTLGEIAELVEGELVGDPHRRIRAVRSLEEAGPGDLAFVTSPRYRQPARTSAAGALLVPEDLRDLLGTGVVCDDPALAVARVLEELMPVAEAAPGIHPTAVVGERSEIDASASIGPFVVLGRDCTVEPGVVLHPGVVVGDGCRIGASSVLHPRVVLYPGTVLGREVILHAGVVLGSDGFGYASTESGPRKIPQVGRVVVEDGVEIGANSAVDRATLEETRIGAGSKLDNLVQVGHNVEIGESSILCGQAGVAGSSRLGHGVVLGGQAGVADHLEVGDGVQVAAKSAVLQPTEPGQRVAGIPAVELSRWRRQVAAGARLGEILRRVRSLEKRLEERMDGSEHASDGKNERETGDPR
ncbi:MAG: UDP-3-O-(3-hydroxymyristoyl)glucosamine N-acyltransferase [Thermoanaerobaculia bacterium]|nr:UDP-3-O-(3-hydroxymyristoyl)glucosamine N-acyltransferase [Thermoanaerobaculia bacterium]